jgi:hypothetical protein
MFSPYCDTKLLSYFLCGDDGGDSGCIMLMGGIDAEGGKEKFLERGLTVGPPLWNSGVSAEGDIVAWLEAVRQPTE